MTNGYVVWLTGLSGVGKSTIAGELAARVRATRQAVEILDGDLVRTHLSHGLGFSKEDRDTNIRRIGFVSNLLARNGVVAVTAAISPYREVRDEVRSLITNDGAGFVEVYVHCPIDVLAERDVKGLYKKAIAGEIKNFTGVSDPYEAPVNPDVMVDSSKDTVDEGVEKILEKLRSLGYLAAEKAA